MQEQQGQATMHVKDGWHFSRLPDGSVRISKISLKGKASIGVTEVTLSINEWESIIASVSAHGDSARGFAMAKAFHQADPTLNFGIVNAVGDKVDNEASKEAFLQHQAEHHAGN